MRTILGFIIVGVYYILAINLNLTTCIAITLNWHLKKGVLRKLWTPYIRQQYWLRNSDYNSFTQN